MFNNSSVRTIAICRDALADARYEADQREGDANDAAGAMIKVRSCRNHAPDMVRVACANYVDVAVATIVCRRNAVCSPAIIPPCYLELIHTYNTYSHVALLVIRYCAGAIRQVSSSSAESITLCCPWFLRPHLLCPAMVLQNFRKHSRRSGSWNQVSEARPPPVCVLLNV